MSRNRKDLIRILVSLGLFIAAYCVKELVPLEWYWNLTIFLAIYLAIAYDVLWRAIRNICHGQIFDENFLMIVATVGAFVIGDYPEAVAVMLFYQTGELFQRFAVGKSRKSIAHLVELNPETAVVLRDGAEETVVPDEVEVGELILVRAGERVPLDGTVEKGRSSLDTSALTGESVPRFASVGDTVLSGTIVSDGVLTVRVEKAFADSTVSRILEMVENASEKKAKAENFITKFARFYTPIVVGLAVLLAIIPSCITGDWATWTHRALVFLVVSCPCALVISVPMSFFGGIGCASKHGILLKGGNYLELLDKTDTVVFDKTGTLTKGVFRVNSAEPAERAEEILHFAAMAEQVSTHPIARSVLAAYGAVPPPVTESEELAGRGILAVCDGRRIAVGNDKLMTEQNISYREPSGLLGSVVHVAVDGAYLGYLTVGDEIKEGTAEAISELKRAGMRTVMLSGDRSENAIAVAQRIGIDEAEAELLPQDKVTALERRLHTDGATAFVGDGINDAPVLMRADFGIAMGGMGSDAAVEAADIVLMQDDLRAVPLAKRIARKTMRIVRENIGFALTVKVAVLILSAFGLANMWIAVFADVGVAVLAILNAMRAMRLKNAVPNVSNRSAEAV